MEVAFSSHFQAIVSYLNLSGKSYIENSNASSDGSPKDLVSAATSEGAQT